MAIHKIGKVSDIAEGAGKKIPVNGKTIAVFNLRGEFLAVDDVCRHKRASLARGDLTGESVSCPLHGWKFNLRDGSCKTNPEVRLETYPVTIIDGELSIDI